VRDAARTMVGLLALAHGLEADLAVAIDDGLDAGELPNLAALQRRFTPKAKAAPEALVILLFLAAYDRLIAMAGVELAS
jgi:hypothetical protein